MKSKIFKLAAVLMLICMLTGCADLHKTQKIETLDDLNGLTVGVQNGTTGKLYCEGDADWGFDGFGFTTIGYDNGSLAVQNIINGNCKYVVIDEGPAKAIAQRINDAN